MAGQIAELADHTLRGAFRHIDSTKARVILLEGADAVLPPMGPKLGLKAQKRLEKMGVEVQLGAMVTDVDRNGLTVKYKDGTVKRIESATKVWSAGVAASPLGRDLATQTGVELDRAGRVKVGPDLTVPGNPNVWVVGDMMAVDGVPGMAQGAIQGGRYAANLIKAELAGADPASRQPFKYFDKGSMATVSRFSAVAQVGKIEFGGFIAWLAWLFLHLIYLVGFKTKIATMLSWITTFLGKHRGQLTITEQQAYARTRIEQLEEIAATVEDEKAAS
jgi:NADH dehydrogenase